ncbi:MAG TPA: carboxymuconolactone decarboxylase family protein [Thermoleophilaceae bacterium]|nr:carboxymuconolactone decarboxylase family protein [Thermoleophilaceae bacterium]
MSRIPYPADEDLDDDARELLGALPPLNIVRMFANAPAALRPLVELGQANLLHAELDARLRQIAILSVARDTGSEYERAQHENVSRAVGVADEDIEAAVNGDLDALDPDARLVARFATAVARDVDAGDELTAAVLDLLGRRQATELVVCCAYYSAVARIIATCGVEVEETLPTAGIDADDWGAPAAAPATDTNQESK